MGKPENNPLSLFTAGFIKWLVFGSFLASVLVYLITSPLIIKPVYRSEALIYVPLMIFTEQYDQHGIGFGGNAEIDGHIQILRSTRLYDSLDSRFRLADKWNIDINSTGGKSRLHRKAGSVIRIEKNRYNAISVSVHNTDAETAASVANAVVSLGDIIKEDILLENRLAAYHFSRELYEQKESEIRVMEERTGPVTAASGSGNQQADQDKFRQRTLYEAELLELTRLKNDFEKMKKGLEFSLPGTYIVSPAYAPDKPFRPGRGLLSIAAVPVYIVLMIFVAVIRQDAD